MREILYRGKRIDNGEWVEGSLWLYGNEALIFGDPDSPFGRLWHKVDPDTVGQYTGLTDKNGKKIFEGDILQRTCSGNILRVEGAIVAECWNCSCCDGVFGFSIDGYGDLRNYEDCEIIGNIHDHTELLKGGEG